MGKDKTSKSGRRKFLESCLGLGTGLMLARVGAISGTSYLNYLVDNTKYYNDDGLVILINDSGITKALNSTVSFYDLYTARVSQSFGFKPRYVVRSASSSDLKSALHDPNIQNISILGHGTWGTWVASDFPVTYDILKRWYTENPISKKGLLLKHTCGTVENEDEVPRLKQGAWIPLKDKVEAMGFRIWENDGYWPKLEFDYNKTQVTLHFYHVRERVQLTDIPEKVRERFKSLEGEIKTLTESTSNYEEPIFGIPFFDADRIGQWRRSSFSFEFIYDPFAGLKYRFAQ